MQVVAIVILYLLFVGYAPRIMESRKPFSLKIIMLPYNFAMVVLSAYIVYEVWLGVLIFGEWMNVILNVCVA